MIPPPQSVHPSVCLLFLLSLFLWCLQLVSFLVAETKYLTGNNLRGEAHKPVRQVAQLTESDKKEGLPL